MIREVKWENSTSFTGRNGIFKCNGVELWLFKGDTEISPITSKGLIGNCKIIIPKDKIKELIEILKEFQKSHD